MTNTSILKGENVRFAVTGGRDYQDAQTALAALATISPDAILVHGGARGADQLAANVWATYYGGNSEAHPADWTRHGKAAGFIRNQEMVDSGIAFVIAFPGGNGTADMVRRCRKAGIHVIEAAAIHAYVEGS